MVVYGIQETMQLLLDGVIENLLCFEELPTLRVTRKNKVTECKKFINISLNSSIYFLILIISK